jgi:hypothetical protein
MKAAAFPVPVTVRVTPDQAKWLARQAEDREVWVSDVIRELIDAAKRPGV